MLPKIVRQSLRALITILFFCTAAFFIKGENGLSHCFQKYFYKYYIKPSFASAYIYTIRLLNFKELNCYTQYRYNTLEPNVFNQARILNYLKFSLFLLFAGFIAFTAYEFLKPLKQFLVLMGVLIIVISSLTAIFDYIQHYSASREKIDLMRYRLGAGILFGLELMVGADIIETVLHPSYYDIGLLGLLIIIRSFLSYFLNKEMKNLGLNTSDNYLAKK